MEHGVIFDVDGVRVHSKDWNLNFISYDLDFPNVKETYIDIEGANGKLDLTEAFGKVFYTNRKITLNFDAKSGFNEIVRNISTFLHGKVCKITLYDDAEYYYLGRVSFDKYSSDRKYGKVILKCECEPWKYKQTVTIATQTIKNRMAINFKNDRMESVPTFKSDAQLTLEYKGVSYLLQPNQPTVFPTIIFTQGDNFIVFIGNGVVTVEWKEGTF